MCWRLLSERIPSPQPRRIRIVLRASTSPADSCPTSSIDLRTYKGRRSRSKRTLPALAFCSTDTKISSRRHRIDRTALRPHSLPLSIWDLQNKSCSVSRISLESSSPAGLVVSPTFSWALRPIHWLVRDCAQNPFCFVTSSFVAVNLFVSLSHHHFIRPESESKSLLDQKPNLTSLHSWALLCRSFFHTVHLTSHPITPLPPLTPGLVFPDLHLKHPPHELPCTSSHSTLLSNSHHLLQSNTTTTTFITSPTHQPTSHHNAHPQRLRTALLRARRRRPPPRTDDGDPARRGRRQRARVRGLGAGVVAQESE